MRKFILGVVISLLVLCYPTAAWAATDPATTTDTTTSTTSSEQGPQSPPGPDGRTYIYNPETGLWENDHYTWDPVTKKTTIKQSEYTYNPDTKTYDTPDWQYNPASGKYEATPPPAPTVTSSTDNNLNATLDNTITSNAQTGDATVSGNTTAGDATTGNANVMANVINLLQSSFSTVGDNGGVVTFMANIPGDVSGNLMVDPGSIAQNQTASSSLQAAQGVKVNNDVNGQINNALLLNASSGNAGVIANTTAGNATSGNANAVANIVNMMNSSVGANQSFVGVINVQGDLVGDILLPQGFLDSLIASNAPGSNNSSNTDLSSSSTTNNNVNQAITNNVSATAGTGNATVDHNTAAGSGSSGHATTNLTVMNLTGSDIIGNNALLVFVNVGGQWTGLIMNAPGSTSAALGGGITQDKTISQTFDINNNVNQGINNDVMVNAQSGDATVAGNTRAGNATSGNATATVNLANVINSHISLANWFGVLFINIGGNWNGSFGTAQPTPATTNTGGNTGSGSVSPVFQFISRSAGGNTGRTARTVAATQVGGSGQTEQTNPQEQVLATESYDEGAPPDGVGSAVQNLSRWSRFNVLMPMIGAFLGALLLGGDKLAAALTHRS